MPRQPQLSQKNGYWYSRAGGRPIYFGKVREVSFREARQAFCRHLQQSDHDRRPALQRRRISVLEVCSRHLDWVRANRSTALFASRKSILTGWCNHLIASAALAGRGKLIGELPADLITRKHFEEYPASRPHRSQQAHGKTCRSGCAAGDRRGGEGRMELGG